jgi:alkanesulfonate monooxygenase SsuD/methylene tetrahydromethanopterin reductase-like flavin-dependent oxidoreductase (luciferase family)
LRTDVIIALFQQPVVLARRLATLDHLSRGRLDVGLGMGWMPEEFAATGIEATGKAARFEECVRAIRACWGPDPVEFDGRYYRIPRARIGPKPTNGTIRIDIGAVARPAVERATRLGDGLTIGFRDWDSTIEQIGWYREAGGTGPVVARAGPMLVDAQHTTAPTAWGEGRVVDDLRRAGEVGIDEIVWDLNIVERRPAVQIAALEGLAAALELPPRG